MLDHHMFLAMQLARERAAEADRYRLAALARSGETRVSLVGRFIAQVAVAIARAGRALTRPYSSPNVVTRMPIASHHDN